MGLVIFRRIEARARLRTILDGFADLGLTAISPRLPLSVSQSLCLCLGLGLSLSLSVSVCLSVCLSVSAK